MAPAQGSGGPLRTFEPITNGDTYNTCLNKKGEMLKYLTSKQEWFLESLESNSKENKGLIHLLKVEK